MQLRLLILPPLGVLSACTDYSDAVECIAAFTLQAERHGAHAELTRLREAAARDARRPFKSDEELEADFRAATERLREERRSAGAAADNDGAFDRCWTLYQ